MITEIIAAINTALDSASPSEGLQFWGLAKLMLKGTQVHPVADANNGQIAINDGYPGIVYHRALSSDANEKEEFMFGSSLPRETVVRIRTVLAYRKSLGRDFTYTLAHRVPETLVVSGLKYVDLGDITIIEDDNAIYEQEFSGGDYEKRREPWIIRAFEYDVKFLIC
jgi:hypothetical protein